MQNSTESINEIKSLEKKYWDSMILRDYETAVELTDFPCIVAGERGTHAFSREEFKKLLMGEDGKIKDFKFDEDSFEVRQISRDTAVIAYKLNCTFQHDGKDKTIEAVDTSTWVKKNGKWLCAMHTEVEMKKNKSRS